jgi:hypothetical protein
LPERNLHSFSVKPRRAEALAAGRGGTFAFRARTIMELDPDRRKNAFPSYSADFVRLCHIATPT